MIECKEKDCEACFNEENHKYIKCLDGKIPKYGLAHEIASYLTIHLLKICDRRPASSNWDIYMMIEDVKTTGLTQNEIDLIITTYKEIFIDLLKKDEEELRQIF